MLYSPPTIGLNRSTRCLSALDIGTPVRTRSARLSISLSVNGRASGSSARARTVSRFRTRRRIVAVGIRPPFSFDHRSFRFQLSERAAIAFERRLFSAQSLPAEDDDIRILRIQFAAIANSLGQLRGGQRRTAP